jgi:hypothetical protein
VARCSKMQQVDLIKVKTPDGVYHSGVPDIPSQNGNLNGEVILNQRIWKLSGSLPNKPLWDRISISQDLQLGSAW